MDAPALTRHARRRRLLLAAGGLLLFATLLLPAALELWLVVRGGPERAEALVVMAGSPGERLPAAVRLYRQGAAPRILLTNDGVLSAWSPEQQRNLYHVEWAELELLAAGVPRAAIVILPFSASGTMYDAGHAVAYARAQGLKSLLVVTSDYHTRRTLWCFRRAAGTEPLELGVVSAQDRPPGLPTWERCRTLITEGFKFIYYQLRPIIFYAYFAGQ